MCTFNKGKAGTMSTQNIAIKQNIKHIKPIVQNTKIIFSPVVKKSSQKPLTVVKTDPSKATAKSKVADDVKIKSFKVVDSTKAGNLRTESELHSKLNIKEEDF